MAMGEEGFGRGHLSIGRKLWQIHWLFVLLVCATAAIGIAMLYSAANGSFDPWASRQTLRFGVGVGVLIVVALIDVRFWFKYAYAFYFLALVLLAAVEVAGSIGMGAQRWISLGPANVQPSEVMKIGLILALARFFHGRSVEEVGNPVYLIVPLLLVIAPVALVLRQPDLGTAGILIMASGALFFLAGVRVWKFAVVAVAGLAAIPVIWQFLFEYQKKRVLFFLNPESDPLGSGYHIIQSKIALGSGGLFGKGFLQGTQSHLSFLPEKQTDFIFTMLAEEFGLVGGLVLIGLYLLLLIYGFAISLRSRNQFGRIVGMGITTIFFLYIFINIAMVMGLIPVVGAPLPLISYGGTAMVSLLFGFGLLMGVYVHRDVTIGRRGGEDS
ncbi:MAG: rod shape-determining protein RodA [Rhodospirillales bacterium]|jgi:rod shape determining protein RodA|nr:rod shape-determining protein RodA [Rhodospirillales bacterium]